LFKGTNNNLVSLAKFGTDNNDDPEARIGPGDNAHIIMSSHAFKIIDGANILISRIYTGNYLTYNNTNGCANIRLYYSREDAMDADNENPTYLKYRVNYTVKGIEKAQYEDGSSLATPTLKQDDGTYFQFSSAPTKDFYISIYVTEVCVDVTLGTRKSVSGSGSVSYGVGSVCLGRANAAERGNGVAIGYNNIAAKSYSVAIGTNNNSSVTGGVSIGYQNQVDANYGCAIGYGNIVRGKYSHAEGGNTTTDGSYSHAEGYHTTANGYCSHAEGYYTIADGDYSHAEGGNTITDGFYSHAEGYHTTANSSYSHAEGYHTTANASYTHAEGFYATASGLYSHAEGYYTTADGDYSHAEGCYTKTYGNYSHAQGYRTIARSDFQTVLGRFNEEDTDKTYAVIVGNGTDTRSNALTVD